MKKLLILTSLILMSLSVSPNVFAVINDEFDEGQLRYRVVSEDPNTAWIIGLNSSLESYSPDLIIPEYVVYNGNSYLVNGIDGDALYGSPFTSVTIPPTVEYFGYCCMAGGGITDVFISDLAHWCGLRFSSVETCPLARGRRLFVDGVEAVDLVIPEGVKSIGLFAFNGCASIKTVKFPSTLEQVKEIAFYSCPNLERVEFTDTLTTHLGQGVFAQCRALKEVILPKRLRSIEGATFQDCNLTSIDLPETMKNMLSSFEGNENLIDITCRALVPPTLKSDIFYNDDGSISSINENFANYDATVHVPKYSDVLYKNNPGWNKFANIVADIDVPFFDAIFNEDMGDILVIGANSTCELTPAKHKFGPATGIQFDMTFPAGLILNNIVAYREDSDNDETVRISFNRLKNNDYRVMIFTTDASELGDLMLGMNFSSDAELTRGTLKCHNIIHSIYDNEFQLEDELITVTGYDIVLDNIEITEGNSIKLNEPLTAMYAGVNYRWGEVDNPTIAELSQDGNLTAKAPGSTSYKLYVKDGEHAEMTYEAVIKVIELLYGDLNGDGELNISDVVMLINYILERDSSDINMTIADMDHNGKINIVDLTMLIKKIFETSQNVYTKVKPINDKNASANEHLHLDNFVCNGDGTYDLSIQLNNLSNFSAIQTDLILPETVEMISLEIGDELKRHSIEYANIEKGRTRVIIYSLSLDEIPHGENVTLAQLKLKGSLKADDIITTADALACDADGKSTDLADTNFVTDETSKVLGIDSERSDILVYGNSIEVINAIDDIVTVTSITGAIVERYPTPIKFELPQGIFVVSLENAKVVKKIIIK